MQAPSKEDAQKVEDHFEQRSSTFSANYSEQKSGKNYSFNRRLEITTNIATDAEGALLDCACGSGEITESVLTAGKFRHAVVVDISESMLTQAEKKLRELNQNVDIEYIKSDIFGYIPKSKRLFDLILCLGLIAHTGKLEELLSQLSKMLSPNGKIILQSSLLNHPGVRFTRSMSARRYRNRHGYELTYYTYSDIKTCVRNAGLHTLTVERYCLGLPFADRLWPLANYSIEILMERISKRVGAEAIIVLEKHRSKE